MTNEAGLFFISKLNWSFIHKTFDYLYLDLKELAHFEQDVFGIGVFHFTVDSSLW